MPPGGGLVRKTITASFAIPDGEQRFQVVRQLRYFGVTPMESNGTISFTYYGEPETVAELRDMAESYGAYNIRTWAGK